MLQQQNVRQLFNYDAEAGIVTRRTTHAYNAKLGDVVGFKGNSSGHLQVKISGVAYWLHRIIWLWVYGYMPVQVDHKNQNGSDNRIENLREVTHTGNQRNRKRNKNNKTGVMGVYPSKGKFCACIRVNGKSVHLGTFALLEDARSAREHAEEKYNFHPNHGKIQ